MKHKTLRTLLCVILTVCFCLSAIAPVSAAGLFSGDTGAASIFDEWIRSLKDRFTEIQPGNDATPVANETAAGNDFIRIFHLDCGRKYFTVAEIKGIIDQLAANNYTHIELAFGNDGFRFLLDETNPDGSDVTIEANGIEYKLSDINAAIKKGNIAYSNGYSYYPSVQELTEDDMNTIISYAKEKKIGVIPLIDIPGHTNTLVSAMETLNVQVERFYKESNNGVAFNVEKSDVAFVKALVKKYVDYFYDNDSKYFNIGADECGYSVSDFNYTLMTEMIADVARYIKSKSMTAMMFNDGFKTDKKLLNAMSSALKNNGLSESDIAICYWTYSNYITPNDLDKAGYTQIINTSNKWYYVAGNNSSEIFNYNEAKSNIEGTYSNCRRVDNANGLVYDTDDGCMLAYWCDNPRQDPNLDKVYYLIQALANKNPTYFTAPVTPVAPTITASKTTLTVGDTATLSISTDAAATWSVDNADVVELSAAATEAGEAVTATAKAKGTAVVSADVEGTALSVTLTVNEPGEVTWEHEQTITVTANNTVNIEISDVNYSGEAWETDDPTIATVVSVTGQDAVEAKEVYTATRVTYSTLAKNAKNNQGWIKTDYYYEKNNDHYPVYVKKERSNGPTYYYYGYSVSDSANAVETIGNKTSNSSQQVTVYTKTSTDAVPASTTFVIKGLIAGKSTSIVIGNTKYTINVIAEDLSSVTPLPIQLWITNNTIEGSGTNAKTTTGKDWGGDSSLGGARYISVPATTANATSSVYSEAGMLVVDAFAAAGMTEPLTRYEWGGTRFITAQEKKAAQDLVFWTGRIHNSTDSNIQKVWGGDYSTSGEAFTYVRYYGKTWSVSADGVKWTDVTGNGSTGKYSDCKQQLAAYYMIRTKITDEVTTDVADWGKPKGSSDYDSQVNTEFVLLDFAVRYEDGTRSPNTFPVSNKTLAYHCESNNAACGADSSGNRYRMLNNFRAVNTSDFEVYMVTVTMTNDAATGKDSDGNSVTLTASQATGGYEYKGVEQIVWAIDEETRANSKLNDYSAISGSTTYSGCKIGGEPYVRGVEIYNKHGALITYYIRAKESDSNLIVHYLDRSAGDKEFYSYNIVVSGNTLFDESFAQVETDSKELTGNKVINKYNVEQTVSADLTTMPAIPAQYRYVDYTCVEVKRSDDGKEVFLYYTFDADVSFVVDFGLPLTIPYAALNENLSNPSVEITKITAGTAKYGTLSVNGTESITYTPNQTIDTKDSFNVTCTGTIPVQDKTTGQTTYQQGEVTYTVYIIPATNVYYEESFMTPSGSNSWGTSTTPTTKQTTELGGAKTYVYGYEQELVKGNTTNYSGNSAYVANLNLPADKKSVYTKDNLTFSFTGAGFDLISECGKDTGMVVVRLENAKTKEAKVYIIDTYFHGDDTILNNTHNIYQTPVIRELALGYGTYNVTIRGALYKNSGTVVNQPAAADVSTYSMQASAFAVETETFDIRAFLDDCGFEDVSVDDVELVYMDENSVLNGGTGIQSEAAAPVERSAAFSTYAMNAETEAASSTVARVTIDGFRVYNPLKDGSDVYTTDNESGVKYNDLSKYIQSNSTTGALPTGTKNVMYVEYNSELKQAESANYNSKPFGTNGPKYEIYLAPNCGIAVGLPNDFTEKDILQLSAKIVSGTPTLKIGKNDGSFKIITVGNQTAGLSLTGTEMYYDISDCIQKTTDGKKFITIINGTSAGEQKGSQSVLAVNVLKMSENKAMNEMSEETQNYILASLTESMATPIDDTFEPEVFEVYAPTTARRNRTFSISANVSVTDLEKVTIAADDGTETELNALNRVSVKWGISSEYYYLKTFRMRDSGEHTFKITAYGKDGSSVSKTVTVLVK